MIPVSTKPKASEVPFKDPIVIPVQAEEDDDQMYRLSEERRRGLIGLSPLPSALRARTALLEVVGLGLLAAFGSYAFLMAVLWLDGMVNR